MCGFVFRGCAEYDHKEVTVSRLSSRRSADSNSQISSLMMLLPQQSQLVRRPIALSIVSPLGGHVSIDG